MATPGTLNLSYHEGDDESYVFQLTDSGGLPIPLVGATVACEVRDNPGGTLLATASCVLTDASNGIFTVNLDKDATRAMAGARLKYDIQVTTSGGKTRTYLIGDLVGSESPLMVGGGSAPGSDLGKETIAAPHCLQNTFCTGFMAPHCGHLSCVWAASRSPHSLQNLLPSRLAVPHFGQ